MFSQQGLSLDQAPPISVVFRFFFSGSLFGILAGIAFFFYGREAFDPSSAAAVTLTHILTLGVMLSFMFASLFQMLPVIAGVTLTSPVKKANWVQYPLIIGIVILLAAFNYHHSWLYSVASVLLAVTLLSIVFLMLQNLGRIQNHTDSSRGMVIALISFTLLVLLALYLTGTLGGYLEGSYYLKVKEAHYSLGLFGWITLLIIAISFQVIEMFYVTPPYPILLSKYLTKAILLTLLADFAAALFAPQNALLLKVLLVIELITYAVVTLLRLSQRKRPIADATVWFWRLGMGSLIISMTGMFAGLFISIEWVTTLTIIFFATFALSIVFGMFYKIIPFLTWFHLNSQGYFTAPMMHEVIHPKTAKKHFWIHTAALSASLLSIVVPQAIYLFAGLLMLSFGWMSYQIIHAHFLYKKTQSVGEKFDMGAGS